MRHRTKCRTGFLSNGVMKRPTNLLLIGLKEGSICNRDASCVGMSRIVLEQRKSLFEILMSKREDPSKINWMKPKKLEQIEVSLKEHWYL